MHKSRLEDLALDEQDRQIEQSLVAFRPSASRFTAASIRTRAALKDQQRQVWWWRGISAALAASLAVVLWPHSHHPTTTLPSERVVYVAVPNPPSSSAQMTLASYPGGREITRFSDGNEYLAVRQRVIGRGMSGLISPEALMQRATNPSRIAPVVQKPLPRIERAIDAHSAGGPIPLLLQMMSPKEEL